MNLNKKKLSYIFLFISYFLFWFFLRISAIINNVLHMDDFLLFQQNILAMQDGLKETKNVVGNASCTFPPQDNRWGAVAIFCVLAKVSPGWVITIFPKYIAGASLAAFGLMFTVVLRRWTIPLIPAVLMTLMVLGHPIINEITLWNTPFIFSLWLAFCLAAYLLLEKIDESIRGDVNFYLSVLLLLCVVLSYEIYLIVFLTLILTDFFAKYLADSKFPWHMLGKKLTIFFFLSVFYVLSAIIAKKMGAEGRGFVNFTDIQSYLHDKIHGAFNMLVNVYMPIISYYHDAPKSFSYWKWIPIITSISGFLISLLYRRGLNIALMVFIFPLLILFIPISPVFLMGHPPDAWRVSVPVLVASIFGLAPIMMIAFNKRHQENISSIAISRGIQFFIVLLLTTSIFLEAKVTIDEAKLRASENSGDTRVIEYINAYWSKAGLSNSSYKIGIVSADKVSIDRNINRAQKVTTAYHERGINSAFSNFFSWRAYLFYKNLDSVEIGVDDWTKKYCGLKPESCQIELEKSFIKACNDEVSYRDPVTGLGVVHDVGRRYSVVCI